MMVRVRLLRVRLVNQALIVGLRVHFDHDRLLVRQPLDGAGLESELVRGPSPVGFHADFFGRRRRDGTLSRAGRQITA